MEIKIQCDLCPSKISAKRNFHRHNETHHENRKVLFCDKDFQYFADLTQLEKHWFESHNIKSVSTCDVCDKSFINVRSRNTHIRVIHGTETKVKCKICNKFFSTSFNLKVHLQTMHGNSNEKIELGSCTCDQCGKRFTDGMKLKLHTKHSHLKKHKCDKCIETFDTQKQVRHHFAIEHNPRKNAKAKKHDPLNCKICNIQITNGLNLKFDYKCDMCEEIFAKENELSEHAKIHLVEFPVKEEISFIEIDDNSRSKIEIEENAFQISNVLSYASTNSTSVQVEDETLRSKISELNSLVELLKRDLDVAKEENVKLLWENRRFRKFCKCE